MEIQPPQYEVWINAEEARDVREALRQSGESEERVQAFSGAAIHRLLEAWAQFVATDWTRWDLSEYLNEIGVRNRLELIRSALGDQSRSRLDTALAPLDAKFRARMQAVAADDSQAEDPRFWVANTIWNTRSHESSE